MRTHKKGFIPAYKRKIIKLLNEDKIKYIGKSADNLKASLEIMPNLRVVIL